MNRAGNVQESIDEVAYVQSQVFRPDPLEFAQIGRHFAEIIDAFEREIRLEYAAEKRTHPHERFSYN